MSRKPILPLLLFCFSFPVVGQNLGDQSSAGFTNARTFANVDLPALRPPLRLFETVDLSGVTQANSLAVFENQFLVGQPGSTLTPLSYRLFSREGNFIWEQGLVGTSANFRYIPAFSNSLVILGGEATTSVKAVNIATGAVVWQDAVGDTTGRFPAVTDNFAAYAGASKIVVRTLSGGLFWQQEVTTAAAALAVRDDSLYFLSLDRRLYAINLATEAAKWGPLDNVASNGASLIASEKYVYVNDPAGGIVAALNAATGTVAWLHQGVLGTFATEPALALAHGRLYMFRSADGDGKAAINVFDGDTGVQVWAVTEPDSGLSHAFLAGDTLYYYHNGQIRVRDAATGALLWSIAKDGVRALTAAKGELYVLLNGAIEVYRPTHAIFMPQLANGQGQTTLVMLANTGSQPIDAVVDFYDQDGAPVAVPLKDLGTLSQVAVTVPPNSSVGIQTEDTGGALIVGWVRVVSDGLLRGTADFQLTQDEEIVREAGVADAVPTAQANIFVRVGGGFNAGVAIADPTEQDAQLTLRLLDSEGNELASETFTLASGAHMANYINEVFEEEVGTAFEGTLVIESDVPVVITAIRTKDGFQISSYPVGQAVR
ncbi:MAG: PQQ-binding-like beta-propeller repeat protein [Acidobacteriota bacterium]